MRKRSSRKIIKNPNDVEKDNNEAQRRQNIKQGERRKDNAQTVQRSKGIDDGESDSSSQAATQAGRSFNNEKKIT